MQIYPIVVILFLFFVIMSLLYVKVLIYDFVRLWHLPANVVALLDNFLLVAIGFVILLLITVMWRLN